MCNSDGSAFAFSVKISFYANVCHFQFFMEINVVFQNIRIFSFFFDIFEEIWFEERNA